MVLESDSVKINTIKTIMNGEVEMAQIIKWDLEGCKTDASNYKNRAEWRKANRSAYQIAWKNGWLELCCTHMEKLNKTWDEAACIADAQQYLTYTDWYNHSYFACAKAKKMKWLDKCCEHMTKTRWDKAACISEASKYQTTYEWKLNSIHSYQYACRHSLLGECRIHMIEKRARKSKRWDKSACIIDAARFKTRTDWMVGSGSAYQAARRNFWLDECCAHMKA